MKYIRLILIYLFCVGFVSQSGAEETDLLQLIQKQYQSILSFSGRFIQTSHRVDTETGPKKAGGLVDYKRPGKMRWLYEKPEEQLLVTNGIHPIKCSSGNLRFTVNSFDGSAR